MWKEYDGTMIINVTFIFKVDDWDLIKLSDILDDALKRRDPNEYDSNYS